MRVLALDLDGVVVTGHPQGGRWAQHLEADFGVTPARLRECFFIPYFDDIILGRADLFDGLEKAWPELGVRGTPRDLVKYWFAADSGIDAELLGVVRAWRAADAGRCVLATNQEHHRAAYIWDELGLSRDFDELFYSAALGARKPDTAYFERVTEKLGVAPADVLFFDDSEANVDAAAAFGWQAHVYRNARDVSDGLQAAI